MAFLRSLGTTLEMIKWEHSIFALPFALTGAVLAANGWPHAMQLFWIIVCMVTARSAAMAFNRWADADLDAANPRTASRAIPAGLLSRGFVGAFTVVMALLFVFSRVAAEPAHAAALAGGVAGAAGLLVYEADHALVAPGAGPRAGHCAGRGMDCDPRRAGPAHPGADGSGALLGGGLRCAVRLPGRGARPRRRAAQHSAGAGRAQGLRDGPR